MKFERERLMPWLIRKINSGEVPGLYWCNDDKTEFRVTWKHAGKPDFELDRDAVLFRMWAEHTGKYKPGEQPDPSTWKTRFRCALRKMPDIEEIRVPHSLDGREPYRVFRVIPKVLTPPASNSSSPSSVHTPSPSPSHDGSKGFFFPPFPGHDGLYRQQGYGPMAYSPDGFPFPSPISSHTSSPTNPVDINNNPNMFPDDDDIDNITPTLPPLFKSFGNVGHTDDVEMTTSITHNTTYSYPMGNGYNIQYGPNGSIGYGTNCGSPGYNGSYPNDVQMSVILTMINAGLSMGMVQEMTNQLAQDRNRLNESDNASMDDLTATPCSEMQPFMSLQTSVSPSGVTQSDCLLSVRVFYDEREVSTFDLNKEERMWRFCYGKPVKPVDNTGLDLYSQLWEPYNAKQIEMPCLTCSANTQHVLTHFNRGLVLEMTSEGDIWATRSCLSRVFFSCGKVQANKLSRGVRTKVFDFSNDFKRTLRESNTGTCATPAYDVTFTLGLPSGALVCIVTTHAQAKKLLVESQQKDEQFISDPSSNEVPLDCGQLEMNEASHCPGLY